jgi:tRNA (guanine-N7-)-methyltransferase
MAKEDRRILYGRRRGRRLRPERARLLDQMLPALALAPEALDGDPAGWFPRPVRALWLEVGFGGGEHLARQAAAHPEIGFIGCEPFLNGVAKLFATIDAAPENTPLDNIRVFPDDARTVLDRLPDRSVDRAFILFPDPWPKVRHNRRRFVAPPQLDALARVMAPGAELRLATDHMDYLRWMLFHCLRHDSFEWLAQGPADWRERPADWPPTRYEEKALQQGTACVYLRFRRRRGPKAAAPPD